MESAIKFARAATKRTRILYCDHAFHGLTTGALALNGGREFRTGFGPLLPGADMIPFGDAAALARELRRGDVAAFIAEPIQGKGVNLAPDEFWQEAQSLCRRHKALMVLDEVQAGMGRSGTFFCHEQFGITPDIITVSKALSGGFVPVGRDALHGRRYPTPCTAPWTGPWSIRRPSAPTSWRWWPDSPPSPRSTTRTSSTGSSAPARRSPRRSQPLVDQYEFLHEVRGMGLMIGLVFGEPTTPGLRRRFRMVEALRPALFSQMIVVAALPPPPHPHPGGGRQHECHQAPAAADRRRRRGRALRGRAGRRAGQCPAGLQPDLRVRQDDGQGHVAPGAAVEARVGRPGPRDRRQRVHRLGGDAPARRAEQEVIALVEPGADTTNLEGLDVKQVVGDLRSRESVQSAVNGCRAVFHVAALYRFWARDPDAFYAINVDGTRNVLGAADEAGVERLVYTSTVGTLGLEHVSGSPLGRRALLPRRPASLRLVQAVQVRGRARGAARHRRGLAGLARPADLPRRARGPRADADRQARPRLPERPHAGLSSTPC